MQTPHQIKAAKERGINRKAVRKAMKEAKAKGVCPTTLATCGVTYQIALQVKFSN